ncbi:MAG TPA: LamG domain-containing protein [Sedimentisphaerales bacterium]|nr:LamG domain-containing protein [Sedimentisphaerales bacterium]
MCKKLIFGMIVIIALSVNIIQAGTISIVDLPATGTDDAIDINSGKTYTHTFDFGSNAPVTINGVDFEQGLTANLSSVYTGTSSWGYGYTMDDTRRPVNIPLHAGPSAAPADGSSYGLFLDFIYHSGGPVGDGTILTLSDLTPGTTYSTRWYYGPFGIGEARVITFEADGESNGIFSDTIELSLDSGGAHYLDYTFTADDTDVTLRFITHNDNQSAHIYGLSNEIAEPVTKAYGPTPKDGAQYTDTWVSLSWRPGAYAVSHDVYMGDNFDDVNNGTGDTFRGNQALDSLYFVVGFTGYAYPDGLIPGTTYYWRIDEVNEADPNSPWKGPVWSFWIPSKKAYDASPADGSLFIDPNVTLTWTAGFNSILHTVFFGESFDEVNNAVEGFSQINTTYTPDPLELEKTYYWRVDELDISTTHKGNVWSFTTLPDVPITDPNLVGWWKLDEGSGATTVDWSGYGNHGAITNTGGGLGEKGSVWVNDPERGIVLSFNGNDSSGAYVSAGGIPEMTLTNDFTWAFWARQHQDQGTEVPGQGDNLILGNRYSYTGADPLEFIKFTPANFEFYNNDPDYLMTVNYDDIPSNVWIHHAGVKKGTTLTYYRNGVESGTSTITKTIQANPFYMAGEPAGGGRWQGWLSDVHIYDKALTLDEITLVMRGDPLLAWSPNPANGSTPYIREAATLSWSPGDKASQHDVYFGIDKDAVANADASDTTGIYRGRQNAAVYISSDVEWGGGPYYWRIDEYNIDETISKGKVWSFTVTDFIGIDNFENYDAGDNQIWYAWKDGLGYGAPGTDPYFAGNGTGAVVGDETTASYTEETIVHGGNQSMPLAYDNNKQGYAYYSEVEHTLTDQRDWTEEGVTELSLWFYGDPNNSDEPLYVAVSNSAGTPAVVVHDDPAAATIDTWTEWVIPLQAFADQGISLTNVDRIAIGLGTKGNMTIPGGSGKMYIDDIRLYQPSTAP